ncbi:hypothetical protein N665_0636s0028 [Sinapis alba]|nr:hypothetical protein N665_0636s0028 [Sinapis alba]
MSGLAPGTSWEHSTPSIRTSSSCSLLCSWRSLSLAASRISPFCQHSSVHSTSTTLLVASCGSISLLPRETSSINNPKAQTSVHVVALPVIIISGAMYPKVPATLDVCGSKP